MNTTTICVPVPFYGDVSLLRRAVDSLLAQSHASLQIVVLNDANPTSPWPELEDIDDDRVWRVQFRSNHGTYYLKNVALLATEAPFLMIQDADDISMPARAATLLSAIDAPSIVASLSAQTVVHSDSTVKISDEGMLLLEAPLDEYGWIGHHHGLYRTSTLRKLGGYYSGQRVEFDCFLTNIIRLAGTVSYVREPLYARYETPGSLMNAPETGIGSAYRSEVRTFLARLHASYLEAYRNNGYRVGPATAQVITSAIPVEQQGHLASAVAALRSHISTPSKTVLNLA